MTTIIDGRKISKEIIEEVKKEISSLPFQPVFCDVLVGNDPASVQYVNMKAKKTENVGIKFHRAEFPKTISAEKLTEEIRKISEVPNICGIIIQIPLPKNFDKKVILNSVDTSLDVDCLGKFASKNFYENNNPVGFPTALACMVILDSIKLDLTNKKIVVLGQGDLVGKPVTHLLRSRKLSVDVITSKTKNKEKLLKKADVIISSIGKGKYITGDMIKKGVVIIDAGTSESTGSIVGDVDLESVKNIASFVSPVPGGVGPVTVAILLQNVLKVAKNLKNKQK
ncbi:MAG: bifunctional 5,10-methylenetetrahydrofolate dehydrogenase/5,10-methenyltetrahydrofolate cyclohydrolase [Patescibacteria group bacterium]